jgi:hypothetical protein
VSGRTGAESCGQLPDETREGSKVLGMIVPVKIMNRNYRASGRKPRRGVAKRENYIDGVS